MTRENLTGSFLSVWIVASPVAPIVNIAFIIFDSIDRNAFYSLIIKCSNTRE